MFADQPCPVSPRTTCCSCLQSSLVQYPPDHLLFLFAGDSSPISHRPPVVHFFAVQPCPVSPLTTCCSCLQSRFVQYPPDHLLFLFAGDSSPISP
ncbi:hypothetical protein DPMN_043662 [Dreissena polymorpha]|uniref:Uncharacterized protein n=1 Tax=Dreissena polymorpha TaxID=45954 RepID=A0A9D4D0W5_DREPO|nr:hypothetical protein DPMN_043662 [Dreissena polymorpha]